jgi:hypothetical protein
MAAATILPKKSFDGRLDPQPGRRKEAALFGPDTGSQVRTL